MIDPNTNDLLTEVVGDDKNDDKRKVIITEDGEDDGLDYEDQLLKS
tara:strand:+ start:370 stop:507 length:138 start_codon:yes stop_codon:yes gene_type:complete